MLLLLLELRSVLTQGVRVVGEGELCEGRHLRLLEAGRARHPTWGCRGQLLRWLPLEPIYTLLSWQVVRVWLTPLVSFEPVDLCCGGELLQIDGGGAPLVVQLQGRPGVPRIAGGAVRWLPAVGGEGVIHEGLVWGEAVGLSLGGGIRSFSIQCTGRCRISGGQSIESVVHALGGMWNGDLSSSPAWGVLMRWGMELVLWVRVASRNIYRTVVRKTRRKRLSGHSGPGCHGDDTPRQAGPVARAALMQG